MRTLLVILPVLLGADGGVAEPQSRPAAYAKARRDFVEAFRAGAQGDARIALTRRREAAPGRLDIVYDVACLDARAGLVREAFLSLNQTIPLGLAVDPATDADLAPLRGTSEWNRFLARFKASSGSVPSPGGLTMELPAAPELVEDVASDPHTGAIFVSSVRSGEVWRRVGGEWKAWAHPAPPGSGAFALGLDSKRRLLHVSVAAVPQATGYRGSDKGSSALVTYRLDDGVEVARRTPPGEGPHLLGDMTVTHEGTVLISDALAGTVFRLGAGQDALEPLVPPHTFASPQTPALLADGKTVLVPDWTLGLFAMPLMGGAPEPVLGPADLVTAGIDGLSAVRDEVIAVQNGIVVPRLVRMRLDPDGHRIAGWSILARGPELRDPTHVIARGQLSFSPKTRRVKVLAVSTSGWARFTDEGAVRPDAPPPRLRLLRLDLH